MPAPLSVKDEFDNYRDELNRVNVIIGRLVTLGKTSPDSHQTIIHDIKQILITIDRPNFASTASNTEIINLVNRIESVLSEGAEYISRHPSTTV